MFQPDVVSTFSFLDDWVITIGTISAEVAGISKGCVQYQEGDIASGLENENYTQMATIMFRCNTAELNKLGLV